MKKRIYYAIELEKAIDDRLERGNSKDIKNHLLIALATFIRAMLLYKRGYFFFAIGIYFYYKFVTLDINVTNGLDIIFLLSGLFFTSVGAYFINKHDFLFEDYYLVEKEKMWEEEEEYSKKDVS